MKRLIAILGICFLLVSGCSWIDKILGKKEVEKTAYELASDGMYEYRKGNFHEAGKLFQKLKDWFPFSKYAILAELKIADSHYHVEEYADAIMAYEEFENLHPRNEAIPYVIYQIGLCYFEQVDTVDRDQTPSREAMYTFKRLIKQFPEDHYASLAEAKIGKCLKSLAGNEFYIGLYYYKSKHYEGALERFKAVISNYEDAGIHYQALQYISKCEQRLKKQEQKKN